MADSKPNAETAGATTEESEEVEIEDEESDDKDNNAAAGDIANQLMQNPQVLAALQDRLGRIVGTPSTYIQSLPQSVKRRIKCLKKLQFESTKVEAEFYKELHSLECKYAPQYEPLYGKRKEVVSGNVEPTDDECSWPSDDEQLADDLNTKANIEESKTDENKVNEGNENIKGIPHFWLTIFKNVDMLSEMVQEHDEPILQHLIDIKVKFSESNPMGFTLEFHFEPNEFFTNAVLTKQYIMKSEPEQNDPFSFEGPEIIKCKGCTIDWKKGKNVTMKIVRKRLKHKGKGTTRTVTKTVDTDSFFNFFKPPMSENPDEDLDDNAEAVLAADFEIGHFIRERIVPRAVLYFTGEALEDEYEDEGDEEHEEEYDDENDADYNPEESSL